jgi:hypothetical protein
MFLLSTNIKNNCNSNGLYIFVRSRNCEAVTHVGAKLRAAILRNLVRFLKGIKYLLFVKVSRQRAGPTHYTVQ